MNKKIVCSILSIIMFVFAFLMAAYSIWGLITWNGVIKEAIEQGQLVFKGSEYNVFNYYVANAGVYLIYALLLLTAGFMFMFNKNKDESDADLDAFFEEDIYGEDDFDSINEFSGFADGANEYKAEEGNMDGDIFDSTAVDGEDVSGENQEADNSSL